MGTLIEDRAAKVKAARDMLDNVKSAAREFTAEEVADLDTLKGEIRDLNEKITLHEKSGRVTAELEGMFSGFEGEEKGGGEPAAKSLGDHFAKAVGEDSFRRLKSESGIVVSTPEFKAAGDDHLTGGGAFDPWLTDVDKSSIVREKRQRPVIADLLGAGTVSGSAIQYFVEGALEGGPEMTAEGGEKSKFHVGDPTPKTDPIKKIAGYFETSDEMAEDLPFFVSEINNRGLHALAMEEERQLFRGDGTGQNLEGILTRSGVQAHTYAAGGMADAIFEAMTLISTATDFAADGVVIHPSDYQTLRLSKDANDQYFGGGFFGGQYGNGGMMINPPIWGLRTVVSPAAEIGKPVVGAFRSAVTLYRKGGVRVESTNSHGTNFTSNKITTRIEERVGLAVRVPSAVVALDAEVSG